PNIFIINACKRFEYCFKNYFCTKRRNCHSYLLASAFLRSQEDKVIRERLQSCTLPICQGSIFFPVIDMSTTSTSTCNCVRRLARVKTFVNLTYLRSSDIHPKMLW